MGKFIDKYWLFAVVISFGVLILSIWCGAALPDGKLHIWFLNVGQGDAILMRLPAGEWILNDGGPDNSVIEQLSKEMPFYERTIDLVIVSHPHADHINGLVEVLKRYQVKNIMLTGVKYEYAGYDNLRQLIAARGIRPIYIFGKDDYKFGKIGVDLIYPWEDLRGRGMNNINNSSIVYRLIYGKYKAFFSGDLEQEKETEVLKHAELHLHADILKAGHHGSKTSSTLPFLERIKPSWAVISCGIENKFGHPFPGTLENFRMIGATVYRTDIDGTVEGSVDTEGKISWTSA